jgi:hypothetical protein
MSGRVKGVKGTGDGPEPVTTNDFATGICERSLRRVVLDFQQQWLVPDQARGADYRYRDPGMFPGEPPSALFGGFGVHMGNKPGEAIFRPNRKPRLSAVPARIIVAGQP